MFKLSEQSGSRQRVQGVVQGEAFRFLALREADVFSIPSLVHP